MGDQVSLHSELNSPVGTSRQFPQRTESTAEMLLADTQFQRSTIVTPSTGTNAAAWTAALVTGRATQQAFTTLAGRAAQWGLTVLFPAAHEPDQVNDAALATLAAARLTLSAIQGIGAAYTTYRLADQWCPNTRGMQEHATHHAATLSNASTPSSAWQRYGAAMSSGLLVFGATGHTALGALAHYGNTAPGKELAYNALVQSLGVATYAITREALNAAIDDGLRPIIHHGNLSIAGSVGTGLWALGLGELGAMYLQSDNAPPHGWLGVSAALEAADAAGVALAMRLHQPDHSVSLLRGQFNVAQPPHARTNASWKEFVYRVGLRSTLRNLLGELTSVPMALDSAPTSTSATPSSPTSDALRYKWALGNIITHVREQLIQADRDAAHALRSVRQNSQDPAITDEVLTELANTDLAAMELQAPNQTTGMRRLPSNEPLEQID